MLVAGSKSATLMGMGIPTFLLGYIIIYENINDTMYDSTNESGVQGGFPQWITISKNLPDTAFRYSTIGQKKNCIILYFIL